MCEDAAREERCAACVVGGGAERSEGGGSMKALEAMARPRRMFGARIRCWKALQARREPGVRWGGNMWVRSLEGEGARDRGQRCARRLRERKSYGYSVEARDDSCAGRFATPDPNDTLRLRSGGGIGGRLVPENQ